ncbi:hypothetical protein KSC_021820 [Ktedonobacter sp. SOSP1-52]|nr:cation:proton antiporter [Ktedonobacter sp. SOSP1-52]GHO63290.1 hypothetical protein KSC_021820 [Ktedonobacter sp. SOSP1-52]
MDIPVVESYLVLFLIIALVTIVVTRKIAVPYTLGLVVVGLGLGISGLLPGVQFTPSLVLFVFLPALLFEGAWTLRWDLLRAHWRTFFFWRGQGCCFLSVLLLVFYMCLMVLTGVRHCCWLLSSHLLILLLF